MKLNIRNKLLAAFMVMIALTVTVSVIALISQNNAQATVNALVNVHGQISNLSQQSTIDMLEARRHEKDYLLRYQETTFEEARATYVASLQTTITSIREDMAAIRALTTEADTLAAITAIEAASAEYETTFLATVALIEQRGYIDTGLEGQFRAKVHDLEEVTTSEGLDTLTIGLLTLRRHEKDYLLRGDQKYVEALHETVAQFKTDAQAANLPAAEVARLISEVDAYQALFDQLVEVDGQIAASIQTYRNAVHKLEPLLVQINETALADVSAAQTAQQTAAQTTTLTVISVSVVAAIIGLVIAFFLSRSLSNAAKQMLAAAEQIAQTDLAALANAATALANGDLTTRLTLQAQPVAVTSSDELGDLGRAFNQMIVRLNESGQAFSNMTANLQNLVGQVAENAAGVSTASGQLAESANQSAQVTSQIATTIQQVAKGAAQQSASVTRTAASVEQMSRAIDGVAKGSQEQAAAVARSSTLTAQITTAIQQVAANAQTGAKDSATAAQTAQRGAQTVEDAIRGMTSIKAKVSLSAQKVQEMGLRSDQIGMIVETIDDIASQTNLLALNAAIEAARAGEHGKGFAVVADEVRKLAEKSAAATKEISGLIKGIQQTVDEAVAAMDEGTKEVEQGASRASEAGRALTDILQASEAVNRQIEEIAAAAQQMNAASNELVTAMDAVSAVVEENTAATEEMAAGSGEVTQAIESIASVSEENSASVEEVSASAEEMTAQVEEVTASAQSLAEMAQTLQTLVSQFKLVEAEAPRPATPVVKRPSLPPAIPIRSTVKSNGHHIEDLLAR